MLGPGVLTHRVVPSQPRDDHEGRSWSIRGLHTCSDTPGDADPHPGAQRATRQRPPPLVTRVHQHARSPSPGARRSAALDPVRQHQTHRSAVLVACLPQFFPLSCHSHPILTQGCPGNPIRQQLDNAPVPLFPQGRLQDRVPILATGLISGTNPLTRSAECGRFPFIAEGLNRRGRQTSSQVGGCWQAVGAHRGVG
jgi:hypothetical protein